MHAFDTGIAGAALLAARAGLRTHSRREGTTPDAREAAGVSRCHATAANPFFSTSVSNFNDAPRGRFSPRSHWLTKPVVTLR